MHLGYTVLAFSQTVLKKVESKTHVNFLNDLISQLKPRPGIIYLKRLTIVLDQDSEKGFGLINAQVSLFNSYDFIALVPTTHTTFSLACLTHSLPSALTAHIISLPLTLPRLPYHLKHTLLRTAIKNGAVFEISYVGALGGESDPVLADANAAETGASAKRNWWAASRELIRVTKGKGLIVSGGVVADADLRPPRDIANLLTIAGISQDAAHEASTKTPKSLVIRAETRKTYRAVFSEPTIVLPPGKSGFSPSNGETDPTSDEMDGMGSVKVPSSKRTVPLKRPLDAPQVNSGGSTPASKTDPNKKQKKNSKKEKITLR